MLCPVGIDGAHMIWPNKQGVIYRIMRALYMTKSVDIKRWEGYIGGI